jgi:hypothetical protein
MSMSASEKKLTAGCCNFTINITEVSKCMASTYQNRPTIIAVYRTMVYTALNLCEHHGPAKPLRIATVGGNGLLGESSLIH